MRPGSRSRLHGAVGVAPEFLDFFCREDWKDTVLLLLYEKGARKLENVVGACWATSSLLISHPFCIVMVGNLGQEL